MSRMGLLAALLCLLPALRSPGYAGPPAHVAPEKFIPTFAICYSDARAAQPLEETAKLDMMVVSFGKHTAQVWGKDGRNSFQSLRTLNPDIVTAIYAISPGECNMASWGEIGEGWEWMKQNHGKDSPDRWVAIGRKTGAYLQGKPYPNERLMELGNPNWRRYWCENVYADYWGARKQIDLSGVDAVFSDNTQYRLIWAGQWNAEDQPGVPDETTSYYADGQWLNDKWRADCRDFLDEAVPFFAAEGLGIIPNFGYMGTNPEWWAELDTMPNPPYAAMEEGGFVCPWGGDGKSFKFWEWERKLAPFAALRHTKALMTNHAGPFAGTGIAAMDTPDANGMTGWDALWFAMTSFLLCFDDVSRNGFFSFAIWSYGEYHYFDEFDPQYLHLGRALGPYEKRGQCHFREFEDGWVAVNGTATDLTGLAVPRGSARVLIHASFKDPTTTPLVSAFDLPAHRGVVLLKDGCRIGNADNPIPSAG